MKILGIQIGKEKAVPFQQFRDMVRTVVRRTHPGATAEPNETGFNLKLPNKRPQNCNITTLYREYCKSPADHEFLIKRYVDSLDTEIPEFGWTDAKTLLRPTIKNLRDLSYANAHMAKATTPDQLPFEPFVGELGAIVMMEYNGTVTGVTQNQLNAWGITFEEAMRQAIDSMNLLSFPPVVNEMPLPGSVTKANPRGEVVGMVFEGDHLTATWLLLERFRDNLFLRLNGDYVVAIPTRSRLIAIRTDEPGMITSMQQANRNVRDLPYSLSPQTYLVSSATTGGVVTVFKSDSDSGALSPDSVFTGGRTMPQLPNLAEQGPGAGGYKKSQPVDFSSLGISEPTGGAPSAPEKTGKGR